MPVGLSSPLFEWAVCFAVVSKTSGSIAERTNSKGLWTITEAGESVSVVDMMIDSLVVKISKTINGGYIQLLNSELALDRA
jgi:hypothetical protein